MKTPGDSEGTLRDLVAAFANDTREAAPLLPPSSERDAVLKKARQADHAKRILRRI